MLLKPVKTVTFDATNVEHRNAFRKFRVRNAWSDAGYRFALDPQYSSLIEQCEQELLKYYFSKDGEALT